MATRYMVAQYAASETLPAATAFDEGFVVLHGGVFMRVISGAWETVGAGPAGADGIDGAAGTPGVDGAPGATGATGPAGADGAPGLPGADGATGATGADGATGPAGAPGVPPGGTTGQVLTKLSSADGDVGWV